MTVPAKETKTVRRILQTLYRLQINGDLDSGSLGTYERLANETLCSMPALLRACQHLVKQGRIVRRKVNGADRERWEDQWPDGYAKRQAHFTLSLDTCRSMEAAEDDFDKRFQEEFDRQIAEDRTGGGLEISNGGYHLPDKY